MGPGLPSALASSSSAGLFGVCTREGVGTAASMLGYTRDEDGSTSPRLQPLAPASRDGRALPSGGVAPRANSWVPAGARVPPGAGGSPPRALDVSAGLQHVTLPQLLRQPAGALWRGGLAPASNLGGGHVLLTIEGAGPDGMPLPRSAKAIRAAAAEARERLAMRDDDGWGVRARADSADAPRADGDGNGADGGGLVDDGVAGELALADGDSYALAVDEPASMRASVCTSFAMSSSGAAHARGAHDTPPSPQPCAVHRRWAPPVVEVRFDEYTLPREAMADVERRLHGAEFEMGRRLHRPFALVLAREHAHAKFVFAPDGARAQPLIGSAARLAAEAEEELLRARMRREVKTAFVPSSHLRGQMCSWEAIDGTRYADGEFTLLELPDGTRRRLYHVGAARRLAHPEPEPALSAPCSLDDVTSTGGALPAPPPPPPPCARDVRLVPRIFPSAPLPSTHTLPVGTEPGAWHGMVPFPPLPLVARERVVLAMPALRTPHREAVGERWHLDRSIWRPRSRTADSRSYWDSDDVLLRAFELDWARSSVSRFRALVGATDDAAGDALLSSVKGAVRAHAETIYRAFRHYAALDHSHDGYHIGLSAYTAFLNDCRIPTRPSAGRRTWTGFLSSPMSKSAARPTRTTRPRWTRSTPTARSCDSSLCSCSC